MGLLLGLVSGRYMQGMSKFTRDLGGFTKDLQLPAMQAKISQSPAVLQVSKSQQS